MKLSYALLSSLLVPTLVACRGGNSPSPATAPAPLASSTETLEAPGNTTPAAAPSTSASGGSAGPLSASSSTASASSAQPAATSQKPATSQGTAEGSTNAEAERCPAGMTFVAGGSFQRSRTRSASRIPDLCVDTLETSARLYADCVSAGKCTTTGLDCAAQSTYGKADKADHPLVCAEFSQAQAYCAFRGKRLPTTDEWEWFARGGTAARTYPWGEEAPDEQLCWAGKHRQSESCPVGSHPGDVSADGILDLGGNVLEFTTTAGDATSAVRIARGGSWNVGAPELFRTARLGGFGPAYRCGFLGIRCVSERESSGQ